MALIARTREVVKQAWSHALQSPDGGPGVMTIWVGMQRIRDFAVGIRFTRKLQVRGLVHNEIRQSSGRV